MDGPTYTKQFEGNRLVAYQDQLGFWTIGVGHKLGPEPSWKGTIWTQDQVDTMYLADYTKAVTGAQIDVGGVCWNKLNAPRQAVLADLAFNMGETGLAGFHNVISNLLIEDWNMASDALLDSKYARQLPIRAKSNALIIETGEWPR